MGRLVNQRRRIWLIMANAFQTILVLAAAGIRYSQRALDNKPVHVDWEYDTRPEALGIIALLSFVFGGQISLAVAVRLGEINTALIDVCLIQFTMDRRLLAWHNPDRNRRAGFLVAFTGGGFLGALAIRHSRVFIALMVVAALKALVTLSFLFNKGITRETAIEKEDDIEANAQTWRRLLSADCSSAALGQLSASNGVSGTTTPFELTGQTPVLADGTKRGVMLDVPMAPDQISAQEEPQDVALLQVPKTQPPDVVQADAQVTASTQPTRVRATSISFAGAQGAGTPRTRPPSVAFAERPIPEVVVELATPVDRP